MLTKYIFGCAKSRLKKIQRDDTLTKLRDEKLRMIQRAYHEKSS